MAKKKKTTEFYKSKRATIRTRKRALTASAGGRTADEVKNEKKRLKEEYRGLKRSEKQQVKREIEEELELEELKRIAGDEYEAERAEAIDDLMTGRNLEEDDQHPEEE